MDVTTSQPAILIVCVVLAIWIMWLLAFVRRNTRQDRQYAAGKVGDLDDLRWYGWTVKKGWPPVTCWYGCASLHREDWWRDELSRTCWDGCAELHRADWWSVYLDQAGERPAAEAVKVRVDLGAPAQTFG